MVEKLYGDIAEPLILIGHRLACFLQVFSSNMTVSNFISLVMIFVKMFQTCNSLNTRGPYQLSFVLTANFQLNQSVFSLFVPEENHWFFILVRCHLTSSVKG